MSEENYPRLGGLGVRWQKTQKTQKRSDWITNDDIIIHLHKLPSLLALSFQWRCFQGQSKLASYLPAIRLFIRDHTRLHPRQLVR